jgi:uncharacterized membrane protein YidH (DUF202 family)
VIEPSSPGTHDRPGRRPEPDPGLAGLQAERTQLAWVRTALACGALAALAARLTGGGLHPAAALMLGSAVALPGLVASLLRIRSLQRQPVPAAATPASVALLTASSALTGALALALVAI